MIIGLTTDRFAASLHKSHMIDCYEKREKDLIRFLAERGLERRAEIFPLDDPFGPTIESVEIEGIGALENSVVAEPDGGVA